MSDEKPEQRQPGIRFMGIDLIDVVFRMNGPVPEQLRFGLAFEMVADISEDGKKLGFAMTTDLFGALKEEERPPINFKFAFVARYEADDDASVSLEEFARAMAPAHVVPFVRELVANITSRSPLPTLSIAPINVVALIGDGTADLTIRQAKKRTRTITEDDVPPGKAGGNGAAP